MKKIRPAESLQHVVEFHQPVGRHPTPKRVARGLEYIELVRSGAGAVHDQGRWTDVRAGTLLWHVPGDLTIERSDFDNPYRCLVIVMKNPAAAHRRAPRVSVWPDLEAVRHFCDEAVRLFHDPGQDPEHLLRFLEATLLLRAHRAQANQPTPEGVRRALELIEGRYREKLLLSEIAHEAAVSVPHLHDQFRTFVGASPHQWLLRRRLRAAQEALLATSASIKEVAHSCGFSNASNFVHTFRKHCGQTPNTFRKRHFSS